MRLKSRYYPDEAPLYFRFVWPRCSRGKTTDLKTIKKSEFPEVEMESV